MSAPGMETASNASNPAIQGRLRSYRRSKRQKPCNACRRRRVACVRQGDLSCTFCTRRNLDCVVEDGEAPSPAQNATPSSDKSQGTVSHETQRRRNQTSSQTAQHIGPTSDHDNFILRHWMWMGSNESTNCIWSRRQPDTHAESPVHFAVCLIPHPVSELLPRIDRAKAFPDDQLDARPGYYPKNTINDAIGFCQSELMDTYFEYVHPAFALLGPQRCSTISSSATLRASMYALALKHCPVARDVDPWIFTDFNKQALNIERHAPKLETIEAALLFAQRHAHVLRYGGPGSCE